ncbi:hypothetical protein [Nocardia brasiliensis]|nr:hypothetical protein [Nocardia brasiliensis]
MRRARPARRALPDGGRIVATGTPAEIAAADDSWTGNWLGRHLAGQ